MIKFVGRYVGNKPERNMEVYDIDDSSIYPDILPHFQLPVLPAYVSMIMQDKNIDPNIKKMLVNSRYGLPFTLNKGDDSDDTEGST